MNFETAAEALSFHCGSNPNTEDPRWAAGFLQSLRPYPGRLNVEAYRSVCECVNAVAEHLRTAESLDRRVVGSLWAVCHRAREWGLNPDGMLRRNHLISEADQRTLGTWIEDLSNRVAECLGENL